MLGDFLSYVWLLTWSWLGLIAGALGSALAMYERAKQNLHPRRYVAILIGFLVLAGFGAWREERSRSINLAGNLEAKEDALQKEIQKHKPDIRVTLEDITPGQRPGMSSNDSAIVLYLTVKNVGYMPSVVHKYALKLDVPNRGSVIAEDIILMKAFVLESPEGGQMTIDRTYAINKKTLRPIAPGGMEQGFIAFTLRGIPESALVGSICTLSWRDVLDTPGSSQVRLVKPPTGWKPPFLPGIEEEVVPAAKPIK